MEANKILQADLLDVLFDGRNKDYGAYELRKKYDKRMSVALGITGALLLAIIGGSVMANSLKGKNKDYLIHETEVVLNNVKEHKDPQPPTPPPPRTQQPQVATARVTPPIIKPDKEVETTELPPIEDQADKRIGLVNQVGVIDDGTPTTPTVDDYKQVVETPKDDPDKIFVSVQIEAKVDNRQWQRYLQDHLQQPIEDAANQGMAPGQYTVQVRFLVEKDGHITDVHALNDPGYGLAKAAENVLLHGPTWSPGEQNGNKVRSYHTQPITFVVSEQ